MWVGEGQLGIKTEGKRLPTRATGALQRLVCCVVWRCGRRRWVEVTGVWRQGRGQWEWSCPVPEGNCSSVRKRVARHSHCSSSEDSWEMPSSSSFSCVVGGAISSAKPRAPPPPPPSPTMMESTGLLPPPSLALQKGDESGLSVWVTQQPPQPGFIHKKGRT